MHNRRARPTLRLLKDDLNSGWRSPYPLRLLGLNKWGDLHPLSELPHPLIVKAVASFGAQPADDNFEGTIRSSTRIRLLEIRQAQWRGAVWEDPDTKVCWLVVGGLAKGNHEDHEDFYKRIKRETEVGDPERWLPTADDLRLLRQETAARLRTEWELRAQGAVFEALRRIHSGGTERIEIVHPVPGKGPFARVTLSVTPVREEGYEADEVIVEVIPESPYAGSQLLWQLTLRVLISIEPPEQRWDRFGDTYSNVGEPGVWRERINTLQTLVHACELAASEPGSISHYAHREHLAGQTINGHAVRGLCGVFFVPTQDHDTLPQCPTCKERLAELPE